MGLRQEMIPILQNRWKLEQDGTLFYYGLRRPPDTFRRRLRISRRERSALCQLDGRTPFSQIPGGKALGNLIRRGIVVDVSSKKEIPGTLREAWFCTRCAANDYILPGLEFDPQGLCPFCAAEKQTRSCRSILPLIKEIPNAQGRSYDAAVFYTGGKDSSYLLYQLAVVRGLRVLALTWELPFLSENARASIRNARKALPHVTFISKKAPETDLTAIYRKAMELQGNVCICPSVAYLLFYPLLVKEQVPYLILGNEPVQVRNLLFNRMAPWIAYSPAASYAALLFLNLGRILSFQKPLANGQFQMLAAIRQLLGGTRRFGYHNELVEHISQALQEAPELLEPVRIAYETSKSSAAIPRLVHLDFQREDPKGRYHWDSVKKLLERELGWVDASPDRAKGLHTSCAIERCKDYSQWIWFREMRSGMMPFSAVELSLASGSGSVSREQAIREMAEGFTLEPPPEWMRMQSALDSVEEPDKTGADGDVRPSCADTIPAKDYENGGCGPVCRRP